MADLGNLYFDIMLRDMTDADIKKIKDKLEKVGVKIGADVNRTTLIKNISDALKSRTFKIDVEPNSKIKKASIEVNKTVLTKSVTDALKGKTFSADLKLVVKTASVQAAIQQAFAQAGMRYNTTASDVRAQRIAEIQQRMALRAANAQRSLGNAYRYSASGAHESARASVVLGRSFHTNIRLAGELGTAMGNFASLFGIKDVLQNLVQIGGQLENQRIALSAILQDGGKAITMFSKIQNLAVKSPFGIMDLNQYTKQLAAYNIPYNELYDTMKRLADISAGVGVDMGRIILAFGQVRAAGFLKGTELRQFTEANIPLVQKLADRFSILEKRIVSAADVYDMISKKKITFEDVKSVLWDLTDEGGMFSGMQEVLSESLASKWKNLADAVDVMYGKMADGFVGSGLKDLAEGLTELTKNWKYVGAAIGSATSAYLIYKASVLLGSRQMAASNGMYGSMLANKQQEAAALRIEGTYRKLNKTEQTLIATSGMLTNADIKKAVTTGMLNKQEALRLIALGKIDKAMLKGVQRTLQITNAEIKMAQASTWGSRAMITLGNAFRSLGAAMKSIFLSPWTWVFAGITALTELWANYSQKQEDIKRRNDEILQSAKGSITTLETELKKLGSIEIGNLNDAEIKTKVRELTTVIKNETTGWQSILSEVFAKEADGTFVYSAKEQLKQLEEKMKELLEAKKLLLDNPDLASSMIEATDGWFDESVIENMSDYANAMMEVRKNTKDLAPYLDKINAAIAKTVETNPNLKAEIEGKDLQEQIEMLHSNSDAWQVFWQSIRDGGRNVDLTKILGKLVSKLKEADEAFEVLEDDINPAINTLKKAMTLDGVKDFSNLSDKWKNVVVKLATKFIDEVGVQEPKMRQRMLNMWTSVFNFQHDLGYKVPDEIESTSEPAGDKKDTVAEMWKKRAAEIEKAVKMYDKWKDVEGKDKALKRVSSKDELANLFNGAYGFNLNLENPEKAYEYIMSKLNPNMEKQKELLVNLGVKLDDATLDDAQSQLKDYLEKTKLLINDITSGWDLYDKLFKATGNKELSSSVAFGGNVSYKNQLEQLRTEIEKEMKASNVRIGFDELIGLNNEELNQRGYAKFKNLIEAYNKESKKLTSDSIKNFIEILNASKDFEQQITDIEAKLQKDLTDLRSNAKGMSAEELKRRETELINKAEEEKTKVNFEEFKKSSDWVKVFDDLDRVSDATLDNMIVKIEEFAKQAHLSEEVTKQLVEAMAKLRDEAIERNPFEGFSNAWNRKKYYKDLNSKVGEYDEHGKLITQQMVDDGLAEADEDLKDSSLAVAAKFQAVADASDLLTGLFENMGVSMDGFLGVISGVLGGAASGAQAGAGIASALGMAGPWGAIAGAAVGMLSSVFAMHDKALQKEIEASEEREKYIKNISSNLEAAFEKNLGGLYTMGVDSETKQMLKDYIKLYELYASNPYQNDKAIASKESIDKAREALTYDSYFDAQLAAMQLQRDELEHQMKLEDEKKKTDKSKIADYEQQIKELEAEIDNFAMDMANSLYGVDFKGWANQLASALVDAWASGEDAVLAYKNTVDDILKEVGVSLISQKILEPLLESTMEDFLAQFKKDDGKLTEKSMEILAGMYSGAEEAASATEAYMEGLKKLGIDVSDTSDEAQSSISKSIQGVSEDTANLLGGYLNSIKQDVSVKRNLIEKLVGDDIPQMSFIAQAQLRELSQIQANTKRNADAADKIYDLVNRVVDKGNNKLKV